MTAPDLATLAGQRAHYAAVRSRLWGPPPPVQWVRYSWHKPVLTEIWSKPVVLEIFVSEEAKIAAIIAGLGEKRKTFHIIQLTSQHYGIPSIDLLRHCRSPKMAHPRMIAMTIARVAAGKSFSEIGRCFSDRDHTTIIHACEKYGELVERAMRMNAE